MKEGGRKVLYPLHPVYRAGLIGEIADLTAQVWKDFDAHRAAYASSANESGPGFTSNGCRDFFQTETFLSYKKRVAELSSILSGPDNKT